MDFCRVGSISSASEDVLSVLPSFFGCLGIQWRNMCFFTESSRWSPLFRRSSTCYIRKHSTHSSYCSPDFVLCMRVICRMWARLRSSLWEKDDFPSSKPPIASAMISNLSNNGFLLCAVFFSMLTAVWPSLWRVRLTFFTHCTFLRKTRQRYGFYPEGDVFLQFKKCVNAGIKKKIVRPVTEKFRIFAIWQMRKKTCLLKLCVASLSCWLWWGMSSVPGLVGA